MTKDKLIFSSFDDDDANKAIAIYNEQGYEVACIFVMDQSSSFIIHMQKFTPERREINVPQEPVA